MNEVKDLLGKTLKNVQQIGSDEIRFTLRNGHQYKLHHNQDCCESVYVEDICGDLKNLVGVPILMAEEATNSENPKYEDDESFTWTFYKFATIKGYVTIRFYGTSNGWYSESVDFAKA